MGRSSAPSVWPPSTGMDAGHQPERGRLTVNGRPLITQAWADSGRGVSHYSEHIRGVH